MTIAEQTKAIIETIYAQLGGRRFTVLTGAKLSYSLTEKDQPVLNIKLPSNLRTKNNIKLVKIVYEAGLDLYKYLFINSKNETVEEIKEVYAEDLISFFENKTGLVCYL